MSPAPPRPPRPDTPPAEDSMAGGGQRGPGRIDKQGRIDDINATATLQGTSHCSCLEHCFSFLNTEMFVAGTAVTFVIVKQIASNLEANLVQDGSARCERERIENSCVRAVGVQISSSQLLGHNSEHFGAFSCYQDER